MSNQSKKCKVTVAFPFPVGTDGHRLVILAEEVCRKKGLAGEPAKMGPHATIIPPFYCTEHEIYGMAAMARLGWSLHGSEYRTRVTGFGVFDPPAATSAVGALYTALEMPEHFRRSVERHKLNWPFQFVHAPVQAYAADRIWNPHISIIEGPLLHKEAKLLLPDLNPYVEDRIVTIGEPLLFVEKREDDRKWWEQVHV